MDPDIAFVPGIGDPALDYLRAVYQLRPNTTLDSAPSITTIADFRDDLIDSWLASGQQMHVGDLFVGAHGSAEGQLEISLDKKVPKPGPDNHVIAVYEDLEAVNSSGTISIPTGLRSTNTSFRLAGCLIGSKECEPFLKKLKEALGNPKSVSAPKYVHSLRVPDGSGVYEYMCYAFRIVSKEALTTRDKVVGTFGALPDDQKQMLDGTAVPDDNWEKWVPVAAKLNLAPSTGKSLFFDFPVKLTPAAGGRSTLVTDTASWFSTYDEFDFKVHVTGGPMPTDKAGQIALVPLALAQQDTFKDSHAYPIYKRYHFKKLDYFVKGLKWKPTVQPGNVLLFSGKRYRYELHIPVVKPGTADELIYNYYPVNGTPIINFSENNQPYELFGIV
jgi:hypothetical protein